ncbi:MAG: alpha/beta fold hydrolase [Planctomycetaceae bacterium]|nr:alpha/beta fold hydrolase [Planctomycetaceae bacterium]
MISRLTLLVLCLPAGGCFFSERSLPLDPRDRVSVTPSADAPLTTRQWLAAVEPQLAKLRPHHPKQPMLTDEMVRPDGKPVDMVAAYNIRVGNLESIVWNFWGLAYSAQAVSSRDVTGPPPWPLFEDVWVPVHAGLEYSARLGWARDAAGAIIDADCIVIMAGIRGDNNVMRVRDLAMGLRACGFHVLAVEVRGTGGTDRRFPNCEYTWGTLETEDLMVVADWLQAKPHVKRTGMIAYSWGANQCLLAAWAEGRPDNDEGIPPRLLPYITRPPRPRRRYEAGMIGFSPVLRFEELMDVMETEQSVLARPAVAGLQATIRGRMIQKKYPNPRGSVHELLKYVGIGYPQDAFDGLEYVRIMPYKDLMVHERIAPIRVPVLLVHAADDMIAPAQDVADFLARSPNPNVAAIMLPTGGHIGFGPYAPAWYYNLILNFFDPKTGAAACAKATRPAVAEK